MQPDNVISLSRSGATAPARAPQPTRNRRKSAIVPASRALRLDMAILWANGSPQDAIGTAAGVMRPCVDVAIREVVMEMAPDLLPRLQRSRDAMRRAA